MGLVPGVFHLDRRRQPFRQHTFVDELGEGLLDQLANGVFHGLLFDRKCGSASRRRWKNWVLSVAAAGLPTFCVIKAGLIAGKPAPTKDTVSL
ncbi:hypothetical protein D9M73_264170 [compost metagenome]